MITAYIRRSMLFLRLGCLYDFASRLKVIIDRMNVRFNYYRIVMRIRRYPKGRKIHVLFWVSETAKWKAQSLYDAMKKSLDFEPLIVLGVPKGDLDFWGAELAHKLRKDELFYRKLGCTCVTNFDFDKGRSFRLKKYSPDIVFYQDLRIFFPEDSVRETAKIALCCDIPYAMRICGGGKWHLVSDWYHKLMFRLFMPTVEQARFYRSSLMWYHLAGQYVAVGHPILDQYLKQSPVDYTDTRPLVIYAPHFSIPVEGVKRPITLSSFLGNGEEILRYAKQHHEFHWLFKPHPVLYKELMQHAGWSKEAVESYYGEWRAIGDVCVQGDYVKYFQKAMAMITDCGSFLVEFPITGKPLIRLVPKELDFPILPMFDKLLSTAYAVHNLNEMYATFAQVLERREDPKKAERVEAVKELGLFGSKPSAERIMDVLRAVCGR